ncbi:formimidoylglutamase [Alteromonas facilis]|uniref:formimidoylglutamase n=1 Tax=Alteromonas facilis TaxID=2048004 RepID=UPI00196A3F59|nr:formimidoylglutamase [Alteromonas facilis]
MFNWQGRVDTEDGERGQRWHQKVTMDGNQQERYSVALVGLACDLGVAANKGRTGAAQGPDAIRAGMANLPWHWQANLVDYANTVAERDLEDAQLAYAQVIANAINIHDLVIGLGGGHEIAWGSYLGLERTLDKSAQSRVGIINFDAHFDLRRPAPHTSSGTPFRQIAEHRLAQGLAFDYACLGVSKAANTPALFDFADTSGTRYLLDTDCEIDAAKALLLPMLEQVDQLYVTICLDAFSSSVAPGVSAPSALGIEVSFVIKLLRWLAIQQKALGYRWQLCDIAEMNPSLDVDGRTAKLAARLGFEIVDSHLSR